MLPSARCGCKAPREGPCYNGFRAATALLGAVFLVLGLFMAVYTATDKPDPRLERLHRANPAAFERDVTDGALCLVSFLFAAVGVAMLVVRARVPPPD